MRYKIVASDFDGTIYTSDYRIADGTKEAVDAYRAAGGRFIIATGRLFSAVKPHLRTLGLTDGEAIVYQGSAIFDIASGKKIKEFCIDNATAVECLEMIESKETLPMMYYEDECYATETNEFTDAFSAIVSVPVKPLGVKLSQYVRENGLDISKIVVMTALGENKNFVKEWRGSMGDRLTFSRANDILTEIVNIEASKGTSLKYVAEEIYGVTRDAVAAVGDAENDISMIKYAGLGAAVNNAMDELKSVADVVLDRKNDDGAVAAFLKDITEGRL